MKKDDKQLTQGILKGNPRDFDEAYLRYFELLFRYAYKLTGNGELAEETVQNVFCRIWEKRDKLSADGFLKAYLYKAVHNECLSHLRARQNTLIREEKHYRNSSSVADLDQEIAARELSVQIQLAVHELPEQCRLIFQMSRFEELRYKEIAESLQLSVKTIENQMGKALRLLRGKLSQYLTILIMLLFKGL